MHDFEAMTAQAWTTFHESLAQWVTAAGSDDMLDLAPLGDEEGRVLWLVPQEGGVAVVVPCRDSSETDLDDTDGDVDLWRQVVIAELTMPESDWLEEHGFEPLDVDRHEHVAWFGEDEPAHADRAAALVCLCLREPWGIADPALVESVGDLSAVELRQAPVPVEALPAVPEIWHPEGQEDLDQALDAILGPQLGRAPGEPLARDDDGDVVVDTGGGLLWVRASAVMPVVEIFCTVADHVTGRTRAAEVLADGERAHPLVKLILAGDTVVAQVTVVASPLVATHLRDLLGLLVRLAPSISAGLGTSLDCVPTMTPVATDDPPAEPVGAAGDSVDDGEQDDGDHRQAVGEDADELPEALQTLVELDAEGRGLDAALVADVCGSDRATILTYLRITSEQEIAWRQAAEEAEDHDLREAEVCRGEADAWDATHESLRSALRFVVDRHQHGDLESR